VPFRFPSRAGPYGFQHTQLELLAQALNIFAGAPERGLTELRHSRFEMARPTGSGPNNGLTFMAGECQLRYKKRPTQSGW
jgi:hypothetical protein